MGNPLFFKLHIPAGSQALGGVSTILILTFTASVDRSMTPSHSVFRTQNDFYNLDQKLKQFHGKIHELLTAIPPITLI